MTGERSEAKCSLEFSVRPEPEFDSLAQSLMSRFTFSIYCHITRMIDRWSRD